MQNPPLNVETSHHSSSSVTVSIFGALSEILSHTTESLSFLTSTTTEHTPLSHTHSTFLSTNDQTPTQIQKIHSDKPKTPITTDDSTTITTTTNNSNTNIDSNEFRLPILNAFDSNEANTRSNPSSTSIEQVDTNKSSSLLQTSTSNTVSKTITTERMIRQSDISDSINDTQHIIELVQPINQTSSSDVMIVIANSDRSSKQINRTAHAIEHTEQPSQNQNKNQNHINTITEHLPNHSQMTQTIQNVSLQSSITRSSEIVMPIYPVYVSKTSRLTEIDLPSSAPIQFTTPIPILIPLSTIISPVINESIPFQTTDDHSKQKHISTTMPTLNERTTTMAPMTTTSLTMADNLNITDTTEHSLNSVNMSIFDIENTDANVNNQINITRLNRIMNSLFNQMPNERERAQTITNTELTLTELTTTQSDADLTTIMEDTTQEVEVSTIPSEIPTTINSNAIEASSIELPTKLKHLTPIKLNDPLRTNPESYVPRFINRIAILPIGFYRATTETMNIQFENVMADKPASSKNSNTANVMSAEAYGDVKAMKLNDDDSGMASPSKAIVDMPVLDKTPLTTTQSPLIYPLTTTEFMSASKASSELNVVSPQNRSSIERKQRRFDFVVYGILANNTVIKRYPEDIYDDDHDDSEENGDRNVPIIYGILSNNTVLRKYPNGTTTIDEKRSSRNFEITNIQPSSLFDPNSEIYRDATAESESIMDLNSDSNSNGNSYGTFNQNKLNDTSASFFNNSNANRTILLPSTVFKLPII